MPSFFNLSDKEQALIVAYEKAWRDGLDNTAICQRLGVTPGRLNTLMPFLLAHLRVKIKQENEESLATTGKPLALELTPERKAEFLANMAAAGGDLAKVCKAMALPIPTVTEIWYVKDPMLKEVAESAADLADLRAVKSLIKRMNGYSWDYKTTVESDNEMPDGKIFHTTSTTSGRKRVEPCINSLKFYLINRMPDKFTLDGLVAGRGGRRSQILAALDSIIGEGAGADEDAQFDKEQSAG